MRQFCLKLPQQLDSFPFWGLSSGLSTWVHFAEEEAATWGSSLHGSGRSMEGKTKHMGISQTFALCLLLWDCSSQQSISPWALPQTPFSREAGLDIYLFHSCYLASLCRHLKFLIPVPHFLKLSFILIDYIYLSNFETENKSHSFNIYTEQFRVNIIGLPFNNFLLWRI